MVEPVAVARDCAWSMSPNRPLHLQLRDNTDR